MPRIDVTITEVPSFFVGANLTGTTGQADDEAVNVSGRNPVGLLMTNKNASAVNVTVEVPASDITFKSAVSKTQPIPGAVGGVEGKRMVMLDVPAARQSTGKVNVDSSDPNIADVTFYAFTWVPTRLG